MNQQVYRGKSPSLAGFLSILPGLGQAYVGHYMAGFVNIAVVGALISILEGGTLRGGEPFFALFMAFFWIFNIVDAVRKAQVYNLRVQGGDDMPVPTDSPLVGGVILTIIGLLLTLEITFNVRLDWLEEAWPLFVLGAGLFLVYRYFRVRDEVREGRGASLASSRREPPRPPRPEVPPVAPDESAAVVSSADES